MNLNFEFEFFILTLVKRQAEGNNVTLTLVWLIMLRLQTKLVKIWANKNNVTPMLGCLNLLSEIKSQQNTRLKYVHTF